MINAEMARLYAKLGDDDCSGEVVDGIKIITHGSGMSECHLGGDTLVALTCEILKAQREGYGIHAWYGDRTEVLIIGVK